MHPIYSKMYYKPLPDYIEIGKSKIEGFGLFAAQDIEKDIDIGSYPFFRLGRVGVSIVLRSQKKHKITLCKKDILKEIVKKKKIKKV